MLPGDGDENVNEGSNSYLSLNDLVVTWVPIDHVLEEEDVIPTCFGLLKENTSTNPSLY